MNEREVFFETIASKLQNKDNVVLLGDYNCVCAREDRAGLTRNRDPSAQLLENILDEHDLTHVAHCAAKADALRYTHFQGASHARLVRIYVSHGLAPLSKNYAVDYVAFSDHCLVSLLLGGRREGYNKFDWNLWKFNAKILKDEKFNEAVRESFDRNTRLEKDSWGRRWELFKQESKMCAIERGTVLTRLEREETKLRNNLRQLLILECERLYVFIEDIALIKNKLEVLDKERFQGATVRARGERFLAGETPTKRALSDEKKYAIGNAIEGIMWQGQLTHEREVIKREFVEHYTELFSPASPRIQDFKDDLLSLMPRLEDDFRQELEEPVSLREIEEAISSLKKSKTPGPDGLSAEFYKHFTDSVAPFLF